MMAIIISARQYAIDIGQHAEYLFNTVVAIIFGGQKFSIDTCKLPNRTPASVLADWVWYAFGILLCH
jgi:hypothetical protein